MKSRKEEIDEQIAALQAEKELIDANERLPKVKQKVQDYINRTYSGKKLMENHALSEEGIWQIYGEDPNCDLGGYHHQPLLATVEGPLERALEYAVQMSAFYTWGGGGDVRKITPIKPIQL